jgi:hypothetical protein
MARGHVVDRICLVLAGDPELVLLFEHPLVGAADPPLPLLRAHALHLFEHRPVVGEDLTIRREDLVGSG